MSGQHYIRCGDCGRYLPLSEWIRKDNPQGHTKALCYDCRSNYDENEDSV